ncbi:hypothetical protein [Candidatus Endomicrobiellum agilis]|uniref:hypothetical protein n=1 Tax=Candidatus Endomicrobiellum agilis TaxID=3238957 RepID=UPI0035A8D774
MVCFLFLGLCLLLGVLSLAKKTEVLDEEHKVLVKEHKVLVKEHKVLVKEHEVLVEKYNVLCESLASFLNLEVESFGERRVDILKYYAPLRVHRGLVEGYNKIAKEHNKFIEKAETLDKKDKRELIKLYKKSVKVLEKSFDIISKACSNL